MHSASGIAGFVLRHAHQLRRKAVEECFVRKGMIYTKAIYRRTPRPFLSVGVPRTGEIDHEPRLSGLTDHSGIDGSSCGKCR
jgi:hypothetical protein